MKQDVIAYSKMTNLGSKKLLYVEHRIGTSTSLLPYVFESNIQSAVYTDLGIREIPDIATLVSVQDGGGYFAGKPTPAKARRKTPVGYDESFVSTEKLEAAGGLNGGFKKSKAESQVRNIIKPTDAGALSVTCYVTLQGGMFYAWNMARTRYDVLNQYFGSLGVNLPSDNDQNKLIWGADFPKPPKVQLFLLTGTDGTEDIFECFVSQDVLDNALPANFTVLDRGKTLVDGLKGRSSFLA